ncbi:MAG: hypothetical protein A2Y80_02970 [Deltaproteobacteria bacterium RBG_13_58_19]|nr:MAG: hypothetical protein A2Y80_02970 [Deltaproteobacteria bacterium RBG_13_58_19]
MSSIFAEVTDYWAKGKGEKGKRGKGEKNHLWTISVRQAFYVLQKAIDAINVAAGFSLRRYRLPAGAAKIPSPLKGNREKKPYTSGHKKELMFCITVLLEQIFGGTGFPACAVAG